MNTSFSRRVLASLAALALATSAQAINFDLTTNAAELFPGNPGDATFVDVREDGTVLGEAMGLYTATMGGAAATGWWVRVDFEGNPQPVLESAFLKAGPSYLWWDEMDLAPFNAGVYTSITLWNSGPGGIMNAPGNAFLETSHAGLEGAQGVPGVPDGGLTLSLLGASLALLGGLRRWLR